MNRTHKYSLQVALMVALCLPCWAADVDIDVDTAVELQVNKHVIVASTDGYTIDDTIAYNESGMDLNWNFITSAGVVTQTNITPTTGGDYDWTLVGNGIYKIEIPATGGASANNDTEGYGWFSGTADGILPFISLIYRFRAAALNNADTDGGDVRDVSVTEWSGTAVASPATAGYPAVTIKDGTGTGEIDTTSGAVAHVVLTDTTTTNTDMRGTDSAYTGTPPTAAAISDAVWDETATGHTDAGKAGEQVWTNIPAILADTNELQTDDYPTLIAALPTAVENRQEIDSNSTQLAAIVADTNELQTDWVDGGRLDLILDAATAPTTQEIWEYLIASSSGVSGSVAEALNAAGAAGDPWIAALPGSYTSGQAGYIVGTTILNHFTAIEGATFDTATDSLESLRDQGDLQWWISDGDTLVDQDTGGTDALGFQTSAGAGIASTVRAYRTADYNAGVFTLRDWTTTDDNGDWTAPMYLTSGTSYTLTYSAAGYQTATKVFTP